nr:MAG TPA: hypothetical protein [Caudoviricetes sp.]
MNDAQRKMMEKLGLSEKDFKKKETVVSNEERINDLEVAVCELFEALESTE